MSLPTMAQPDLDTWFALTTEPRPSCYVPDCGCEGLWAIYWEKPCPAHPMDPSPYCNAHKELVEARLSASLTTGFQCGICAHEGGFNHVGHLLKIERIYT